VSAARAGDERARQAFRQAAEYVGIAISNAIALLWPERVVVGGGVAEAGDLLFEPLRDVVAERAQVAPVERIEIVPAALGPVAGAVGAALWAAEAP
jgi:glucokinase